MSNLIPFNPTSGGLDRPSRDLRDIARVGNRALAKASYNAQLVAQHEQFRAELTHQAVTNIGALASMEQAIVQQYPSAARRVGAVVDAYTAGAIATIMRF